MILEKKIPLGYWFGMIKWDLLIVTLFSSFIFLTPVFSYILVPLPVGVFLGTAIALLLSFKLSQSYDRWWEARKIWGAIVNDCRSLVIQLKNYGGDAPVLVKSMALRQIAWCYALSRSLRQLDAKADLPGFIEPDEIKALEEQKNIPVALLNNQSRDLAAMHRQKAINDYQQMQIDNTLVRLTASMGMAERIKNTAFPKTYRVTLHIFIYVFLFLLSMSLTELHSLIEIPIDILIAIPFFVLDKIAFYIQDPFENRPTDTPMTSISRNIEINIKQILGEPDIPEPIKPETFYIM